jgi:glycosyltransferase involved in cell wall biosynthesis
VQIVGVSLVRNEDRFLRRALLNVASFCDRLFVADHMSSDRTADVLAELASDLDHLEVRRVRHAAESHLFVERLAGTETWVLSVDGDELYDPAGLELLRAALESGEYDGTFRLRPAGLHCDFLDEEKGVAAGYLSPPSRPLVGLLNLGALESWTNVRSERLHGGDVVFRPGFDWASWRHLGADLGWEESPFRCLHVCFLRRSSRDPELLPATGRPNLSETGAYRRGAVGVVERLARRALRGSLGDRCGSSAWKAEKYRRGARVSVDAAPFLGQARA